MHTSVKLFPPPKTNKQHKTKNKSEGQCVESQRKRIMTYSTYFTLFVYSVGQSERLGGSQKCVARVAMSAERSRTGATGRRRSNTSMYQRSPCTMYIAKASQSSSLFFCSPHSQHKRFAPYTWKEMLNGGFFVRSAAARTCSTARACRSGWILHL